MNVNENPSVLCVVGARPNFMKIAPIMRALNRKECPLSATLIHTGQHYDTAMKRSFFEQLHIPEPDMDLEVGSGSHAVQTAEVMKRFEPVVDEVKPSVVLVVGDVNSTIACALVAVKKHIPVVHVEAGLRSFDRSMPEEINRILTDQISDLLFTTERSAEENLINEGIDSSQIHFVGNVMIDTLLYNAEYAIPSQEILDETHLKLESGYGLVTLHRPSNVDDPEVLTSIIDSLLEASETLELVFPVHPRTRNQLVQHGLLKKLETSRIALLEPQGYLQMLGLMKDAKVVMTDSGGIQEETTALGVPCITLRESTERPITITQGTNILVGADPVKIRSAFNSVMHNGGKQGKVPEFWDGQAAERIVEIIQAWIVQG
ncbi:UDP-N-acetylglucosamine 2-epimerase (non-hydrolyzing) [Aestuariicella sp. G3-2]|uniref:non-hydrolyzing UDP-N-acetylglucosamine 2-epimerase n=1 Tax=Pseudomaricurvus albidus TaxID=2842452 RepID=UPI001C0BF035|nr:UDP-N-acetylglucosamine 2-epimerase (non-hydrolyzing) [Aestuariicella albida]MBU3070874.1 UDP-N-acetylglucosamine 2-epimerase (non-hydrolyzing) [Aestuariicella albida]